MAHLGTYAAMYVLCWIASQWLLFTNETAVFVVFTMRVGIMENNHVNG